MFGKFPNFLYLFFLSLFCFLLPTNSKQQLTNSREDRASPPAAPSMAPPSCSPQEPLNYSIAILSTDSEKWMCAMHEEMESLEKNDTWNVVRLPPKKKTLKCKWNFKRKEVMTPLDAKGFS
jgi:hypothetical protein